MVKPILLLSCLILLTPLSARGSKTNDKVKVDAGDTFTVLQESYVKVSKAIIENFKKYAFFLLFALAVIDLSWGGFNLIFDSANLSAFIKFLVEKLFFLALFVYLINNLPALTQDLLDSASDIGEEIAEVALGEDFKIDDGEGGTIYARPVPNSMLVFSLQFWDYLMSADRTDKATGLVAGVLFSILVLIVCFLIGFLGILQLLIYIEINLLLPIYIFILGFGGLKATQATGLKIIFIILGAAFKLLVLNMIVATGIAFFYTLVPPGAIIGYKVILALLLGTMAIVAFSLTLPGKISALIGGMDSGVGRSLSNVGSAAAQIGGVGALGAVALGRSVGATTAGAISSAKKTGLSKGSGSSSSEATKSKQSNSTTSAFGSNDSTSASQGKSSDTASSNSGSTAASQSKKPTSTSSSSDSTSASQNDDSNSASDSKGSTSASQNDSSNSASDSKGSTSTSQNDSSNSASSNKDSSASQNTKSDSAQSSQSNNSASPSVKQKVGKGAKTALVFGGKLAATAALTPFVTASAIEQVGLKNASRHLLEGDTATSYLTKRGVRAMGRSASQISQSLKNYKGGRKQTTNDSPSNKVKDGSA